MAKPPWLVEFSARFGLYGAQMEDEVKTDPVEAFREKAVRILKDLAESERLAHRHEFNVESHQRADAFDRAADVVQGMARV